MRRLALITLGAISCSADVEPLFERQSCRCLRTVQKELDCDGDVSVEYSNHWDVAELPVAECNDDWMIEDAFLDSEGCLVSYYSNGECLNPVDK